MLFDSWQTNRIAKNKDQAKKDDKKERILRDQFVVEDFI